jgi:DNA-binding transcriptional LysR family regulator
MKNLSLDDFALFTQIAIHQSLSVIARQRNVAPSWVSRALARIETECDVRLAHRTTHGLSLTQEGEIFLEHAQHILQEHGQLEDSLGNRGRTVTGCVLISVSQLMAQHVLIPRLAALRAQYPQLSVDLHIDDRLVSMAREGVDIAVRAGTVPPQSLVARPLGHHGRALYASPNYLKRHGVPRTPDDLAQHTLIGNSTTLTHNEWSFHIKGQTVIRTLPGLIRVNSSAAVVALALSGAGIARINDVVGDSLVEQGQLKPVLQRYVQPGQYAIYAMILAERHRAAKIRATMDFLQTCFAAFVQKAAKTTPSARINHPT